MKYFHRTSLSPDDVIALADKYFGKRLTAGLKTARKRTFNGTIGNLEVSVRPEGGHYVRVAAQTDQVGESELDKLAKRFLALVHQRVEPAHQVRGNY